MCEDEELKKLIESYVKKLMRASRKSVRKCPRGVVEGPKVKEVLKKCECVVALFETKWCSFCKLYEPIFEEVANEASSKYDIAFVKIDLEEMPTLAEALAIYSVPTTIFLRNLQEKTRLVGVVPPQTLKQAVENFAQTCKPTQKAEA